MRETKKMTVGDATPISASANAEVVIKRHHAAQISKLTVGAASPINTSADSHTGSSSKNFKGAGAPRSNTVLE